MRFTRSTIYKEIGTEFAVGHAGARRRRPGLAGHCEGLWPRSEDESLTGYGWPPGSVDI